MAYQTIQGHKISNRRRKAQKLKPIIAAIEGWHEVVCEFGDAHRGEDVVYWHNERANIGALAAGAWLKGMQSLEEYGIKRGLRGSDARNGRADLMIGTKKTGIFDINIEAKLCWHMTPESLNSKITAAIADAARTRDCTLKAGCVFAVPYFDSQSFGNDKIIKLLRQYQDVVNYDLLAWVFPESARELKWKGKEGKTSFYPGVVLAMRLV